MNTLRMTQLGKFVEVLGISTALENGAYGDEDTDEQLFAHTQTIANALRKVHEVIQTIAWRLLIWRTDIKMQSA